MSTSPLHCFLAITFALLATATGLSDDKQESSKEKTKRPSPVTSPTIDDDGSVTFRVQAASAKEVFLTGEMVSGKAALTKGEHDIWSVTLQDIKPGVYGYSFFVDGLQTLDGGNMNLKPMRSPRTSTLHLPGDNAFDFKDVPHGTVHYHGYQSQPINRFREMQVYTPPGYETSSESYPVLILQHGHSDSFATWTAYGKAHWILDNLIASNKAVPMIVVMLDGHPIPESYGAGRSEDNTSELETDLIEVALPMVEKLYRVKSGSNHRAIAGLSMGGLHSLTIGLGHADQFRWIGAFSAAPPTMEATKKILEDTDRLNENVKLLWIACGKEDFLLNENKRFIGQLKESGVQHQWRLTEGNHSWPIWRGYLADFAPLLFR
ncbi:MAG: alpha/beta hydrolase-fold protein [Pirellulaceae bacterium]